jgi:hypothetical protein
MRRRPWSEEDVSKLTAMAGRYPTREISRELGRGLGATILKAHQLRISLRTRPKRAGLSAVDPGPAGMDLSMAEVSQNQSSWPRKGCRAARRYIS